LPDPELSCYFTSYHSCFSTCYRPDTRLFAIDRNLQGGAPKPAPGAVYHTMTLRGTVQKDEFALITGKMFKEEMSWYMTLFTTKQSSSNYRACSTTSSQSALLPATKVILVKAATTAIRGRWRSCAVR